MIKNSLKIIYDNFENVCITCNDNEIDQYIKQYNIDVNYDDGYYHGTGLYPFSGPFKNIFQFVIHIFPISILPKFQNYLYFI